MTQKDKNISRIDRYEKKRKNTSLISSLSVLLAVLVIALIGVFFLGGNSNNEAEESEEKIEAKKETLQESTEESNSSSDGDESQEKEDNVENSDVLKKQAVASADENVKEAYTANWEPVGTKQKEPHSVVIEQNTQEWKEMMEAVTVATGVNEEELVAWWVTRGGSQEVIATVSDRAETETFRVYLHWEENKGYRPDKVEILVENDQKYRYQ